MQYLSVTELTGNGMGQGQGRYREQCQSGTFEAMFPVLVPEWIPSVRFLVSVYR